MNEKIKMYKSDTNRYSRGDIEGISFSDKGSISLMCPICYNLHDAYIDAKCSIAVKSKITSMKVYVPEYSINGYCFDCRSYVDYIMLDPNIAPAIRNFNIKGYITKFSCEGHGKELPYVFFKRKDIFNHLKSLPSSWYYDPGNYDGVIIRSRRAGWLKSVQDLIKWSELLPKLHRLRF